MFLTKIKNVSDGARILKISLIGIVGQSWYDAEDESVTQLVKKIDAFDAKEGDEIHCLINSRGGNYFAGVHLYNTLKASKAKVVTKNLGLAASAASVVFVAGDVRICYPGSITMAHMPLLDPGSCNSEELAKLAEDLSDVGLSMKSLYLSATGLKEPALDELLKSEKNMTPEEALSNGFATEISEESEYQAIAENVDADKERLAELEAKKKAEIPPGDCKASAEIVIKACKEAGLGDLSAQFHDKGYSKRDLADSIGNVKAIKDVCAATGVEFNNIKENIFCTADLFKAFAVEVSANRAGDDINPDAQLGDSGDFVIKPINGCM